MSFFATVSEALFGKKELGWSEYYHYVVGNCNKVEFSDRLVVAAYEDTASFCKLWKNGGLRDPSYHKQMETALSECQLRYMAAKATMAEVGSHNSEDKRTRLG